MRVPTAAPLVLAVVVAAGAPAQAAPKKKQITKTYTIVAAPNPNPPTGPSCSAMTEGVNGHSETIRVTGPGKLTAKVSGFVGDWDLGVYDTGGSNLAMGSGNDTGNTDTAPAEVLSYKVKKAQTLVLRTCNFGGTPQATGTFTFTYA